MSKHIAKQIKDEKYIAMIFGEKFGYIEQNGFSSKKERARWIKDELKDVNETEKIYAKEDGRKPDSYFAVLYDYSGVKIS